MSKEEFLRRLEEALTGEVPASVIRENVIYYNTYISQEMARGRSMEEIVAEIGDARIVARTIIDSCEAAGETPGDDFRNDGGESSGYGQESRQNPFPNVRYVDLNRWYWKLLLILVLLLVISVVMGIIGGIFSLLVRFAGPIMVVLLLYWMIKGMRR